MTKIQFSIVKNNDFATIGFHVTIGNERTFTWGIAAEPSMYYVKTQDADNESLHKILELMELDKERRIRENFIFTHVLPGHNIPMAHPANLLLLKH